MESLARVRPEPSERFTRFTAVSQILAVQALELGEPWGAPRLSRFTRSAKVHFPFACIHPPGHLDVARTRGWALNFRVRAGRAFGVNLGPGSEPWKPRFTPRFTSIKLLCNIGLWQVREPREPFGGSPVASRGRTRRRVGACVWKPGGPFEVHRFTLGRKGFAGNPLRG